MKKFTLLLFGILLITGSAYATPFGNDGGSSLQGVLDNITVGPDGTDASDVYDSSIDVTTDYIADYEDSGWDITASGGSLATFIIELAGFASSNSFGVYDSSNKDNYVTLFNGSATTSSQVSVSIAFDGSVFVNYSDTGVDFNSDSFGYFIDATDGNGSDDAIFYSDSTLNADGADHMLAYQGTGTDNVQIGIWDDGVWTPNEYVLAFEDLLAVNADFDYTDLVVMVESVEPVPEPGTMLLLGAGLLAFAGVKRKKTK